MNLTVAMRVVFGTQGGEGGPLIEKMLTLYNWPRAALTIGVPFAVAAIALRRRYVVAVKAR